MYLIPGGTAQGVHFRGACFMCSCFEQAHVDNVRVPIPRSDPAKAQDAAAKEHEDLIGSWAYHGEKPCPTKAQRQIESGNLSVALMGDIAVQRFVCNVEPHAACPVLPTETTCKFRGDVLVAWLHSPGTGKLSMLPW